MDYRHQHDSGLGDEGIFILAEIPTLNRHATEGKGVEVNNKFILYLMICPTGLLTIANFYLIPQYLTN